MYDLAYGKAVPENAVQRNGVSQSSWESWGVLDNSDEGKDHFTYEDEQRAVQSEQCHDVLR